MEYKYETLGTWKKSYSLNEVDKSLEGKKIILMGRLQKKSDLELILRDSMGELKITLDNQNELQSEKKSLYKKILQLTEESIVGLSGYVSKYHGGKVQLGLDELKVFNKASKPLPIGKFDLSDIELLPYRQLVIRSSKMTDILKVRAEILKNIRGYMYKNKVVEFSSQTIALATDPGVGSANLFTFPGYKKPRMFYLQVRSYINKLH